MIKNLIFFFIFYSISIFSQSESKVVYEPFYQDAIDSVYKKLNFEIKKITPSTEKNKIDLYIKYAKILKKRDESDSAIYYFIKAENYYRKTKKTDSLVYINTSMAEVFRYKELPAQAKKYINISSSYINLKNIDVDILAYYYNRKAAIEASSGDLQLAYSLSKKVIQLQNEIKDKEIVIYSYNEIGALNEFSFNKNNIKESLKYYNKANDLAIKYNKYEAQLDVLVNLSRVYSLLNDLEKHFFYIKKGAVLAKKIGSSYHLNQFYFFLKNYYYNVGDYKNAYDIYNSLVAMKGNSDYTKLKEKTIEIEKKYSLSKKESELKDKENEIILKNNELKSNKKITLLFLIIFLIALLAVLTLFYYYRKINNYNKKLEKLSNENEFLLSEANHRINNNLQLIIILISEQLKKIPINQQVEINNILTKIESIATLHRHLYKSKDVTKIDLENYFNDILVNFTDIFDNNNIETNFLITKALTTPENAMYFGLLLTELCINSVKHAFSEDSKVKKIEFEFFKDENDIINFRYFDNGSNSKKQAFKPKLVDKICRQLKINYKIDTENGFLFTFTKNN
ncbi:MAG: sensor histidine kinase [Flavobacterium sp.]